MLKLIKNDTELDEIYFTFDVTSYDTDSISVDIIYDHLSQSHGDWLSRPIDYNYLLYIEDELIKITTNRFYFNNVSKLNIKLVRQYRL